MRKIVMYCDRCKKEFEKWNHKKTEVYGVAEFVHDDSDPYLDEPKDLCESCYTEFENWWNFTPQAESEDRDRLLSVFDKIRSEIFQEVINYSGTGEEVIQAYADGLKKGLDIIDKYKTESEDEE